LVTMWAELGEEWTREAREERWEEREGRPLEDVYCMQALVEASSIRSVVPSDKLRSMEETGKVDGLGMPPPREIMPGRARKGWRDRIALGLRELEVAVMG